MEIKKDILKDIAHSLYFDLEDEEYENLIIEFESLQNQFDQINEVEGLENVDPMDFPFDIESGKLREDEVKDELDPNEVIKNSSTTKDGQIVIPRIIN